MFNSLLNRKEKMGFVLFWWLIIVLSIGLGIQFYKWLVPEKLTTIQTITNYEKLGQVELQDLTQGENVKYKNKNLCVSSIFENREESEYTAFVEINLRNKGNCK